jgi:hypothetical protein
MAVLLVLLIVWALPALATWTVCGKVVGAL